MNVALVGYGRMGRAVERAARERGHRVAATFDSSERVHEAALAGVDVAIDFSVPAAVVDNVGVVAGAGLPLVVGTTGWHDRVEDVRDLVQRAGTGLVWAPNFSLGVQVLYRLCEAAAELAGAFGLDMSVHETHHRHKLDRPSGTARRLAERVVAKAASKAHWQEGPASGSDPEVLWVTSARVGEVPGSHELLLDGPGETITVRHDARGRQGFANGALDAAEWIRSREGFYGLEDMMRERLETRAAPDEGER